MNWIKSTITVLISVIIALLLCEISLVVLFPQNLSGSWRVIDKNGLLMNKSSGSSVHTFDNRKAVYNFEKYGVRRMLKSNVSFEKKVVVLGDSFTFGWLLNTENTYVYKLATAYPKFHFYNAAAGGWGSADYTSYMETYCEKIRPDIALIIMNAFDLERLAASNLYKMNKEQTLLLRKPYVPSVKNILKMTVNSIPIYQFFLERSHLLQLVRKVVLSSSVSNPIYSGSNATQYFMKKGTLVFKRLKEISDRCQADLRVVYIGTEAIDNPKPMLTSDFVEVSKNTQFFEKLGVKFVDLSQTPQLKEYRRNDNLFIIKHDRHPNERGANLIFEALFNSSILD